MAIVFPLLIVMVMITVFDLVCCCFSIVRLNNPKPPSGGFFIGFELSYTPVLSFQNRLYC